MKQLLFLVPLAAVLSACAGDNRTTYQSTPEATRSARIVARSEIRGPAAGTNRFDPGRVYLVTRLETAEEPRGEWRALGSTIRQSGNDIEFVELGSGRTVAFDAPHQLTPMGSVTDREVVQFNQEGPGREMFNQP